jgi:hypothetical protein
MNIILLYFIFTFATPILGIVGVQEGNMMQNSNLPSSFTSNFYQNGQWTYYNGLGIFYFGFIIAQIVVLLLYAARRHDNEYPGGP